MLEQCCNHSKQCRNNVATLPSCAKNRRCELSRVTSPLSNDNGDGNEDRKKAIGLDWQTPILPVHHTFLYISFAVAARLHRESA